MAKKYLWWEPVGQKRFDDARVIAQVLNIGEFDDARAAIEELGEDRLRDVVIHAEPGWLSPRSWTFWNYRLGLISERDPIPPLRTRRFGR
ncbi:MAG TPA: hypothetical protein VFB22_14580 [Candidatus Baltobacteraceae bacterium]|nr:hypothetical protein [Candidatus Baltobacteraceae bacterium]